MVRALSHLRFLLAALLLGLMVAFSAAPAMTFASTPCSETESGVGHESTAAARSSDIKASSQHDEHANWASECCMSGIAAHCCEAALGPTDSAYAAVHFTSVRWSFLSAHRLTGTGPFDDFRPPINIG